MRWDTAQAPSTPPSHLSTTHTYTCRESQLDLLVNDLHGDEVMLLVEATVVEQQAVGLPGCEPVDKGEQVLQSEGKERRNLTKKIKKSIT